MDENLERHDEALVAWVEAGRRSGEAGHAQPTVIFLHAMAGSREAWAPQMQALAAQGYRSVAWDMPGFGASSPASEEMGMKDVVEVLDSFMTKSLGLRSAHLVGLSVGGMILQHFAVAHPERCLSLVILDSSPKFGFGGAMAPADFAEPILAELKGGVSVARFSEAMVRAIVGPDCTATALETAISAMARAQHSGLALATRLIANHDALDLLGRIACPVLALAGAEDRETPPAYAQAIAERIPGARHAAIPGAGHISNLEAPDAVTAALSTFLAAVQAEALA